METIKKMLLGMTLQLFSLPFYIIGLDGGAFLIIGIALMLIGTGCSVVGYLVDKED